MVYEYTLREGDAVEYQLRHYATSRKVVDSRPDEVNEISSVT
jgi:hypothetical protein